MSCECDFEESLAGTRLGIESNFIGCKMKVVFLFVRLAEEKHQQRRNPHTRPSDTRLERKTPAKAVINRGVRRVIYRIPAKAEISINFTSKELLPLQSWL